MRLSGPPDVRGGIKGSFPIDGDYAPFEYVSWGAKFTADSLMREIDADADGRSEPATYHQARAEPMRTSDLLALALHAEGKVLDVGARDGYHARLLADRFEHVTALDLTVPVIPDPRVECVAGDVTDLPFDDDSFDLVLCSEVLEHIAPAQLDVACLELARVTRGHLLVGVPYKQDTRVGRTTCIACGAVNPPWGHVNRFDESRLRSLFAGLSFESIHLVGTNDDATNAFSSSLMDLAGNPYGTYGQDECCVACGAPIVQAPRQHLGRRILTKLAFWARRSTKPFQSSHPNWIHVLLRKG
jgi:SAM-dependent methyltransferase